MSEFELKLRVPTDEAASLHAAFIAHGAMTLRLQARYFDTRSSVLARQGVTLRLRLEDGRWVQALKTIGDGVVQRLEHEVVLDDPADAVPELDPGRHDATDAGRLLRAALDSEPSAALVERHATDIERLRLMLYPPGGSAVEAALDSGAVRVEDRSAPVLEVELEHKAGPLQGVFDVAAGWVHHGGLWLSTLTKAERGERLQHAANAPPPSVRTQGPAIGAQMNGPALMHALLLAVLAPLLAHAGALAEGDRGEQTLHQVRIGLRRLRTLLRELRRLAPGVKAHWDGELATAARRLGPGRDDVAQAALRPLLEAAQAAVADWPAPAVQDPADTIRDRGLQGVLVEVLALAHADDGRLAPMPPSAALQQVAARLDRLQHRLAQAAARYEALPLPAQQRVLGQLERLQDLTEMTAGLWPRRPAKRLLKALRAAHEAAALHRDVAAAATAFRAQAALDPQSWFTAGYLQAHLQTTARSTAHALRRLRKRPACWR
jgi:triphosphatase